MSTEADAAAAAPPPDTDHLQDGRDGRDGPDERHGADRASASAERRVAWATGIGAGVVAFGFLLLGIRRSFDFDESITVGLFVDTPSVWDAFTESYVLNNHVLFSFLDHVVASLTGSGDEVVLRVLPIAFAATACGLLAGLLARRWGWLAGAAGAAVMVTNPIFAEVATQARGYSLLVLCTVGTTAILARALHPGPRTPNAPALRAGWVALYALVGAVGVATHLYMLVVLGIHVVLATTDGDVLRRFVVGWLGALLGLAAYVEIAPEIRETADTLGRRFRPGFPLDLGVGVLGGGLLGAALVAILVLPELWARRREPLVQRGGLAVVGALVAVWIVGPFDLYPRFFTWLIPLVALGVGAAVHRRRAVVLVVCLIVAVQVVTVWPRLTQDPNAAGTAADVFARVRAAGGTPCTLDAYATFRMLGYGDDFRVAQEQEPMQQCTVGVMLGVSPRSDIFRAAEEVFPYRTRLDARRDGVLFALVPTDCWLSAAPAGPCRTPGTPPGG